MISVEKARAYRKKYIESPKGMAKRAIWEEKNRERINAIKRRYASSPHGRSVCEEKTNRWRSENPEKWKAHITVGIAIRNGSLVKKPCEDCGAKKSEAHHDDYSKPLCVRWLCDACHVKFHTLLRRKNALPKRP